MSTVGSANILLCSVTVEYAGLLGRACPAAVYEYQDAEGDAADAAGKKFVINSQNCIHVSMASALRVPSAHIHLDNTVQDMFDQDTDAGYHLDRP